MADFPALPLWTDAYIADTVHLTNEEHGIYLRLLMFAWRSPDCSLPDDDKRLALMVGISPAKWEKIKPVVMEFWKRSSGKWIQKRLRAERDFVERSRQQKAAAGRASAEAKALRNKEEASTAVNQPLPTERQQPTPTPIPTPNKEKEEANASRDLLGNLAPAEPAIAERAVAMWNDLAAQLSLPKVQRLTETRERSLKARLKECGGLDGWAVALERVAASPLLRGEKTDWHADFDFLMQQKSFTKLMEGGYSAGPARRGKSPLMEAIGRMANGE
jgi:uncharacterized protein YdaU (DUF1376 family)